LDDKYRIERQIGAGGMGAVYEATHTAIGRRVAIKTLHLAYAGDEQLVQRFHREAQMAGSIGHDNICEVTDIGKAADGSPYLVMPLLAGAALSDVLEGEGQLPFPRLIDIIAQTLSALQAAHEARIVHRDLKPDNIFVTKIGDRKDFVKLLDFGISKLLDQDAVLQLTQTGTVLGTPFYMAPEQAKGSKEIDHRVDLYAVGVILYEALTGQRPFEGDTYNEIMYKIIAEPCVPPSQINPQVPPQLEQIVLKAMARDPDERFASAVEMRRALAAAVAATPLHIQVPVTDAVTAVTPGSMRAKGTAFSATAMETVNTGVGRAASGSRRRVLIAIGASVGAVVVILAVAAVIFLTGREPDPPVGVDPAVSAPVPPAAPAAVVVPVAETPPPVEQPEAGVLEAVEAEGEPQEQPPAEAAAEPAEAEVAKKGSKKGKKGSGSSKTEGKPQEKTAGKKAGEKVVKGRFGTTFVGEYDE